MVNGTVDGKKIVDGFIMENKEKGARIKCTVPFRQHWEKMGFKVIYSGKIDITDWMKPVTAKELRELGFDIPDED